MAPPSESDVRFERPQKYLNLNMDLNLKNFNLEVWHEFKREHEAIFYFWFLMPIYLSIRVLNCRSNNMEKVGSLKSITLIMACCTYK